MTVENGTGLGGMIVKRLRSTEKGMSILSGRNASFVVRKVVVRERVVRGRRVVRG